MTTGNLSTLPMGSNPFATRYVRPGALVYRFPDDDDSSSQHGSSADSSSRLVDMTKRLNQHRVGLIVGPHGSGKSTLLQTWLPLLRRHFHSVQLIQLHGQSTQPMRRWTDQRRALKQVAQQAGELDRGGLLILDGAEQLGRWNFRSLTRTTKQRGQVLLATSHRRLPVGSVLHRTSITPHLANTLARQLIIDAPQPIGQIVEREFNAAWDQHSDNVRELFFALYDVVQQHLMAIQELSHFDVGPEGRIQARSASECVTDADFEDTLAGASCLYENQATAEAR